MITLVTALSIFCFVAGVVFCFFPIEKYRSMSRPGGFGALLVVCGVILMTTFKWTEVVIEVGQLKAQIKQAQAKLEEVQLALNKSEQTFSMLQASTEFEVQKALIDKLAGFGPVQPVNSAEELQSAFQKALSDSNYVVLPASEVRSLPRS
jgi:uncharacterized membrane protein